MVTVKPCQEEDIALLREHIPTPGQPERHTTRFERQQHGHSTFLIAWAGALPVGAGELLWRGCSAPEINQHYPDCPELNGLDVWPPELRSRGIGTALIAAAEKLAHQHGRHRIGLGVDDGNPRAAALYLRLGYRETGRHYLDRYAYVDSDGTRHEIADPARFLVKDLP
ncbi:GNAT family N-acetyltransferase [Amycolatopsis sp. QT-25]|uniref:GNAT family N-acetyltransferase n=1 Tax=Amycolatopsis sp. QT-25 TaxID=3034022 RepID=UPI0023EC126C|nr:GNAT family N-acetyltransferase [Amycolatopsis sp. QT-25]WET81647.1 GNAT family N-acetyltransferase [Amycolatopsis sp. QT-25]